MKIQQLIRRAIQATRVVKNSISNLSRKRKEPLSEHQAHYLLKRQKNAEITLMHLGTFAEEQAALAKNFDGKVSVFKNRSAFGDLHKFQEQYRKQKKASKK